MSVFVFGSHAVDVLTCHLPQFKICEPIVSLCDWLGKLSHVRFNETPNFKHNRDTACSKIAICITIKYSNVLALPQHFTNRLSLTLLELNGGGDAGTDTFSSHPTFVFRSCQYNNVILTRSNEYDNICRQTNCACVEC